MCIDAGPSCKQWKDRIETYKKWKGPIPAKKMAKAGFYCCCDGLTVRCPWCGVEVFGWEKEDDPIKDHKRHSPYCDFVLNKI